MAAKQEQTPRDYYNEARLLIRSAKTATLATCVDNRPHAAFVTLAFLPDFAPILLLSQLAVHTRHLEANPACALLLTRQPDSGMPEAGANPQTTPRLCLTGTAAKTDDAAARAVFLDRHPYATGYADFMDFAFWRILLTDCYYIGGFAAAGTLDLAKLFALP